MTTINKELVDKNDYEVYRKDNVSIKINISDQDGNAVDLTQSSVSDVKLKAFNRVTGSEVLNKSYEGTGDNVNGEAVFDLTSDDTDLESKIYNLEFTVVGDDDYTVDGRQKRLFIKESES